MARAVVKLWRGGRSLDQLIEMSPRQLTALLSLVNEQERQEAAKQLLIAGVGARGKDGVLEKYINEWSG